jgi:hypothetical protein
MPPDQIAPARILTSGEVSKILPQLVSVYSCQWRTLLTVRAHSPALRDEKVRSFRCLCPKRDETVEEVVHVTRECTKRDPAGAGIGEWVRQKEERINDVDKLIQEMRQADACNLVMLVVASRQMRAIVM